MAPFCTEWTLNLPFNQSIFIGLFLPWLNGVAVHLLPAVGTSRIVNGVCLTATFWPSLRMNQVCK